MTTALAYTSEELELESAELLPARETLWGVINISPSINVQTAVAVALWGNAAAVNQSATGVGNTNVALIGQFSH